MCWPVNKCYVYLPCEINHISKCIALRTCVCLTRQSSDVIKYAKLNMCTLYVCVDVYTLYGMRYEISKENALINDNNYVDFSGAYT